MSLVHYFTDTIDARIAEEVLDQLGIPYTPAERHALSDGRGNELLRYRLEILVTPDALVPNPNQGVLVFHPAATP